MAWTTTTSSAIELVMRISTQELKQDAVVHDAPQPRDVLLVSQLNDNSLPVKALRMSGWRIVQRSAMQSEIESFEACRVGIVRFKDFDSRFLSSLQEIFHRHPHIRWLALVDKAELEDERLRKLIHESFYDFHTLPIDFDRLNVVLGHAYGFAQLLDQSIEGSFDSIDENGIVGVSPEIAQLRRIIKKAGCIDSPILISGESGTGKQLVAAAIYANSAQRSGPFIAVNCASLAASEIHAELFGQEQGAFGGEAGKKIGRIESAAGGTLYLDEIGGLSSSLQLNLLRFLEERTITRVGGLEPIPVKARIIAATDLNLESMVEKGLFRKDLYYRLNVIQIRTTPLRQRREDIEHLARHFLEKFRDQSKRTIEGFNSQALLAMHRYDWPGNIRELSNKILRAVVVAEAKVISAADLDLDSGQLSSEIASLDEARGQAEAMAILATMAYTKRNLSESARLLGVTRATLYRLLAKHNIPLTRQGEGMNFDSIEEEKQS